MPRPDNPYAPRRPGEDLTEVLRRLDLMERKLDWIARRVAALVDASKIGQEHLVSFAGTDDVDLLVTDATITGHLAARLTDSGTEVIPA